MRVALKKAKMTAMPTEKVVAVPGALAFGALAVGCGSDAPSASVLAICAVGDRGTSVQGYD